MEVVPSFARAIHGDKIKITSERGVKTKNRLKIVVRVHGDTFSPLLLVTIY